MWTTQFNTGQTKCSKCLKKISKTIYKMVILFIMVPVFFNDEIVFY